MRMVKFEDAASLDPRRHFLVVLTPEGLEKQPLSVPIFEIVEGRHARMVDCQSPEGRSILIEGRNVLYVGATNIFDTPVRNVRLVDVLEGLIATSSNDDLRASLEHHLTALTTAPQPRAQGAAA